MLQSSDSRVVQDLTLDCQGLYAGCADDALQPWYHVTSCDFGSNIDSDHVGGTCSHLVISRLCPNVGFVTRYMVNTTQ
jgi:hypothetical protein